MLRQSSCQEDFLRTVSLFLAAQMEGMVLDLSLAKEKQQNFEAWQRQEGRSLPIEMTVQVLTTGFWPQYKVRSLPPGSWMHP